MFAAVATFVTVVLLALPRGLGLRRSCRPLTPNPSRGVRAERWNRRIRSLLRRSAPRPNDSPWIGALESMARATATGSSLAAALGEAADAPGAPAALGTAARSQRSGRSIADALSATSPTNQPDEVLALGVLRAVARAGGPAAAPLDRAAGVLRERRAAREERSAAAAQAQLSARVLSVLPAAVALWSVATDPDLARLLLGTPIGGTCLLVGGGLNLGGWWWMRRIVRTP